MIREFQSMRQWLQDHKGERVGIKPHHTIPFVYGILLKNSRAPDLWQVSDKGNDFWVFRESELWTIDDDLKGIFLKSWPPFSD